MTGTVPLGTRLDKDFTFSKYCKHCLCPANRTVRYVSGRISVVVAGVRDDLGMSATKRDDRRLVDRLGPAR